MSERRYVRPGTNAVLIDHPNPYKPVFLLLEPRHYLLYADDRLVRITQRTLYDTLLGWYFRYPRSGPFQLRGMMDLHLRNPAVPDVFTDSLLIGRQQSYRCQSFLPVHWEPLTRADVVQLLSRWYAEVAHG